jgi:hypothetical protein
MEATRWRRHDGGRRALDHDGVWWRAQEATQRGLSRAVPCVSCQATQGGLSHGLAMRLQGALATTHPGRCHGRARGHGCLGHEAMGCLGHEAMGVWGTRPWGVWGVCAPALCKHLCVSSCCVQAAPQQARPRVKTTPHSRREAPCLSRQHAAAAAAVPRSGSARATRLRHVTPHVSGSESESCRV